MLVNILLMLVGVVLLASQLYVSSREARAGVRIRRRASTASVATSGALLVVFGAAAACGLPWVFAIAVPVVAGGVFWHASAESASEGGAAAERRYFDSEEGGLVAGDAVFIDPSRRAVRVSIHGPCRPAGGQLVPCWEQRRFLWPPVAGASRNLAEKYYRALVLADHRLTDDDAVVVEQLDRGWLGPRWITLGSAVTDARAPGQA